MLNLSVLLVTWGAGMIMIQMIWKRRMMQSACTESIVIAVSPTTLPAYTQDIL